MIYLQPLTLYGSVISLAAVHLLCALFDKFSNNSTLFSSINFFVPYSHVALFMWKHRDSRFSWSDTSRYMYTKYVTYLQKKTSLIQSLTQTKLTRRPNLKSRHYHSARHSSHTYSWWSPTTTKLTTSSRMMFMMSLFGVILELFVGEVIHG